MNLSIHLLVGLNLNVLLNLFQNCATSGGRSKRRAETRTEGADTESLVIELDIDSDTQNSDTGIVIVYCQSVCLSVCLCHSLSLSPSRS